MHNLISKEDWLGNHSEKVMTTIRKRLTTAKEVVTMTREMGGGDNNQGVVNKYDI